MKKKKVDLRSIQANVTKALKDASRHLEGVGKETAVMVKKGEDELVRMSKMGKAQLEILALSVRKEQLYRQIGMRVWQLSTSGTLTTRKLKKFCDELAKINSKVKVKKKTISKVMKKGKRR